jgi:hypothetical protein
VIIAAAGGASGVAQDEGRETDTPRPPSGVVEAVAQGSTGGLAPEPGAPPPLEVSLEPKTALGSVDRPTTPRRRSDTKPALRAISFGEGEATVDVGGRTEVLRPGSRLGADVVKSVSPGRLVLLRPEEVDGERHEALVLVTFDATGTAKTQVFWTHDHSAPQAPEVVQR